MSTWTERMQRRAATLGNVVTSCGHPNVPYPRRLEKKSYDHNYEVSDNMAVREHC